VRLDGFHAIIDGHEELEQGVRSAYSFLDEHRYLQKLRSAGYTAHTPEQRCSSIFAGNRVIKKNDLLLALHSGREPAAAGTTATQSGRVAPPYTIVAGFQHL
jgi:hypothetical protein